MKKRFKLIISLIFIVTVIAYGQTLSMYFWIDDNAMIYKLQHVEKALGFFGKGAIGEGPYRHIANQFVPFYPIFKTNPTPYYAVGLLLYFLAALTIYFFVRVIAKNNLIALGTSLIFASGYVGSETLFGIMNSWQTSRGIIMALVTFLLYFRFFKTKKLIYYLVAVALFFFSIDTVYIRAHGLIFAIIFFDILFWPVILKFKSIFWFVLRQIPFLTAQYIVYIQGTAYAREFGILSIFSQIFSEEKFYLITIPIQDLGNLFIPDKITAFLDLLIRKYLTFPPELSFGSTVAGVLFLLLVSYLIITYRKTKAYLVKVLVFATIWMVVNFIVFYAREPFHTLGTTHRYFSYSFFGLALFWSTSFYLVGRTRFKILISLLVTLYLVLGVTYQYQFNNQRSFPVKNFFKQFTSSIPRIPQGAYLYFDIKNENRVKGEFGSFFGGMFSEAANLAIHSEGIDYMNDFIFTYKFEDILEALAEGRVSLDRVFTFYYGDKGLIDTTADVRKLLQRNMSVNLSTARLKSTTPYQIVEKEFITSPQIVQDRTTIVTYPKIYFEPDQNIPSLIPSNLRFSMRITPLSPPIPFESPKQTYQVSNSEKSMMFDYLISQEQYFKTASASAASYWKEQEPRLAIDNRLETAWRGHRGFWDEIFRKRIDDTEFFVVDLKTVKRVSQVIWVTAQRPLIPTDYKLLTSADNTNWVTVKSVKEIRDLPSGSIIIDSFAPVDARFVKMEIYKTLGNDGPEIKEFEVVEEKFTNLDRNLTIKVKEDPFSKIEGSQDYNDALNLILATSKIRIYFRSDADIDQDLTKYQELPILIDGRFHEYSLSLPASGIGWLRFSLEGLNFPAEISLQSLVIKYQSVK